MKTAEFNILYEEGGQFFPLQAHGVKLPNGNVHYANGASSSTPAFPPYAALGAIPKGYSPINDYVKKTDDSVNHPKHYARWKMEPVEFIAINDLPWWLANVIKYTMRYDAKDGLQDLYKARSYLDMKIRQIEGLGRFWEKPVSEERKLNRG